MLEELATELVYHTEKVDYRFMWNKHNNTLKSDQIVPLYIWKTTIKHIEESEKSMGGSE